MIFVSTLCPTRVDRVSRARRQNENVLRPLYSESKRAEASKTYVVGRPIEERR